MTNFILFCLKDDTCIVGNVLYVLKQDVGWCIHCTKTIRMSSS